MISNELENIKKKDFLFFLSIFTWVLPLFPVLSPPTTKSPCLKGQAFMSAGLATRRRFSVRIDLQEGYIKNFVDFLLFC